VMDLPPHDATLLDDMQLVWRGARSALYRVKQ
jgi:hypothetical protein